MVFWPFAGIASPTLKAPTSTLVKSAGMSTKVPGPPPPKVGPVPPAPVVCVPAVPPTYVEPPEPVDPAEPVPWLVTAEPCGKAGFQLQAKSDSALAAKQPNKQIPCRRGRRWGADMRASYEKTVFGRTDYIASPSGVPQSADPAPARHDATLHEPRRTLTLLLGGGSRNAQKACAPREGPRQDGRKTQRSTVTVARPMTMARSLLPSILVLRGFVSPRRCHPARRRRLAAAW